ncbi:MAG: crotonase/enoyl-CoA hydratase family protein [Deltaproteobacteria bacterium]|nr:crotonase/enoyl-CoA hydratase family protein [Deltaproteobacteria bacterium]
MELTQTTYSLEKGIAVITLNRAEHLNAFTLTMRKELISLFEQADKDDGVRTVVVTGAGRAFCAGADLSRGGSTFDRSRASSISDHRDGGGQVALAAFKCRKPVIAAINGHAVGIGITMTLAMDMRIASEEAKIGFVFPRRGLVLEACSSWFLPRLVGMGKAAELVFTGRTFRASEEKASGLFNHVLPPGQVVPKAMEIAREIADNTSAVSVGLCKALLWHGLGEPDPQSAHLVDSRCFYWAGKQEDAREGIQAFLEKRPPRFAMRPSTDMPDFYPWWKEPKV